MMRRAGIGVGLALWLAMPAWLAAGPALAADAPVAALALPAHQRLLPLQGGRNFRDLGGYATADGRHVKWGVLFRSGSMHGLTDADYAWLEAHGIRTVCDFRSTRERTAEPVDWPAAHAPTVFADDYELSRAGLIPAGDMHSWTDTQARVAVGTTYVRMLGYFSGQYRRMFAQLLAGHAPLAFNCSAGKDRTGIAAALLLTALGVPRDTVIADYVATDRYLDARALMNSPSQSGVGGPMAGLPPAVVDAFLRADPSYVEAALAVLDSHPGGAEGWLKDEMGLGPAELAKLRGLYLE